MPAASTCATATPPHYGVLFAVGLTAGKLGQRELDPDLPQWRALSPASWLALLECFDAAAVTDGTLGAYVAEVRREAGEHRAAVALAHRPSTPRPLLSGARRGDEYLEDFAWLSEVRARFEHPHWCERRLRCPGR